MWPLLLACFVVSGASGLVLEVVWSRLLAQVLGSSSLAIATVLATFMGGLALGGAVGGRVADRPGRDPLRAYAACELGIAAYAALVPLAIERLHPVNAALWRHLGESPLALAGARFVLCAALLVAPTALMGATLPLLARAVVRARADLPLVGARVGALYAANLAGAVLGAALAGFSLIPLLGLRSTNLVAVAADLLVAGAALALARRLRRTPPAAAVLDPLAPADATPAPGPTAALAPDAALAPSAPAPLPRARLALVAFAASGAIAMALQVLWSRALALVIGSSVYSFTLVLVVFLLGLAAGAAWIGRPAARARDPHGALALVFLGAAAAVALTVAVIDELPRVFLALLAGAGLSLPAVFTAQIALCAVTVAPAAACLGAVMPLVLRAVAGSPDAVGRDVGRAYAANTIGAILGSVAGGFALIPLLGVERGIRLAAIADAALAALVVVGSPSRVRRHAAWIAAAVLAFSAIAIPRWDLTVLHSGVFRMTLARRWIGAGIYRPELLWSRDGVATTVTVERHGDTLAMKNNGKVEASSSTDMPTQILVGLLPVLLHGGDDLDVAVVGYGSGVTVGAIAESPTVARVDVVELEPRVYEAADRFFGHLNHRPEANPRVRRHIGDGRDFLAARPATFDVIVSEPSNPWMAGVAGLFSREFYRFARARLAEGGVYCQWAQLYELGPANVKMIYRTFQEAFPHVYAFSAADASADTILVGSLRPLPLDLARLAARLDDPRLAVELHRAGIESAADLVALLILAPDEVPAFAAGADVHTDDLARLEFAAPRDLLTSTGGPRFADLIYGDGWPYGHLDGVVTGVRPGADDLALARALVRHGKRREGATWLARAERAGADGREVARLLELARVRDLDDPEVPLDVGGPPLVVPDTETFAEHVSADVRARGVAEARAAHAAAAAGRWREAADRLAALPPLTPGDAARDLRLLSAFLLYKTLDFEEAEALLEELAADPASVRHRPAVRYYLGRVRYGRGAFRRGAEELERFARAVPGP